MPSTTCLFLRLDDLEHSSGAQYRARWQWCGRQGQSIARSPAVQPLDEIASNLPPAARKSDCQLVVLLPGQSVLVATAPMMEGHAQDFHKIHKAAAYAVEDQLAEPAEEVHSAVGSPQQGRGSTANVAIIRDAWMRKLMQELGTAGLVPDVVTSEAMLLPCEGGKAFGLIDEGHVIFRFSDTIASRLELDVFLIFLEQYLAQAKAPVVANLPAFLTLQLWTADATRVPPPDFMEQLQTICRPRGITVTCEHTESGAFDLLCQNWLAQDSGAEAINLLQGPYQGNSGSTFFPSIKAMAVILAVWFVLQVAFNAGSAFYFDSKADEFHAQSVAIYHRLFPADPRIVDLKAQFTQHLNPDTGSEDNFMQLLSVLAGGMAEAHHPEIQMLQYDAGKNELSVEAIASDFANLESFKHLDADVEVGSAVKEEKGIRGQIRIRGKSGKEQHG